MDFAAAWTGASAGDAPDAAICCGWNRRCARNEPLHGHDDDRDDEQSDDDEVELAGRLCGDRGVALHLVLALRPSGVSS
jgi:hypothetical protein